MITKIRSFVGGLSLGSKIKLILLSTLVPLVLLCGLLLVAFHKYSGEYDRIIESLTVASEFSYEFQEQLDYKMYQYVVRLDARQENTGLDDVAKAREIVNRLKGSTIQEGNLKRLQNIERLLGLLEQNIRVLHKGGSYDFQTDWLDKRVRTLTALVKEQIQEYIYYETTSLAVIRQQIRAEIRRVVLTIGSLFAILALSLFVLALRVSGSIAKPIKELSDNIRSVGEGDFTLRPVSTGSNEVQALSETFEGMVDRIRTLMDNIRQERDNLRLAEFRLLQAQINPHFLYNTLDTVIWLAEDKQNTKVIQLITSLSAFFRSSLSNGEDVISVREEALHVRSYLEIQQMRYQDILTYEIDVAEELHGYRIPKLTLQPIVENALYHGVKNKRGLGRIAIRGWMEGSGMTFRVTDDGIGMSPETLAALRRTVTEGEKRSSFGLFSVYERLQLYYHADSSLSVDSEYGVGTTVTITLPARER